MSIDSRYVSCADLQQYLVDKQTGLPLSGGLVYFYQDNSRTTLQNVYELTGNAPNYSFSPLPNPLVISSYGTVMDNDGNDVVPYYLPWLIENGEITTTPSLYYVVVQNSAFIPQFTREAWPPNSYVAQSAEPNLQTDFNYIPNGQFLIHNSLPNNGLIAENSTILAPGGFIFNIQNSVSSTNLITFEEIGSWTDLPPQSPRFQLNINCTSPSSSETYKALSVTFNDVNKFANEGTYTFGFWGSATTSTNVAININKYFGVDGSSFTPVEQGTVTITPQGQMFSVPVNFETNAGDSIGTGITTVSIDISFNTALGFDVTLTDFVLIAGASTIVDFPAQTNADMVTRSVNGWTNVPDYNGLDLYLPAVLTPFGMQYDHTIIGRIEAPVGAVAHPGDALTATPSPIGNLMPCDGDSYIMTNFSTLGIPYSRLGNYLIANSAVPHTPMYGTGANFATIYTNGGNTGSMRLTVNSSGAGIAAASEGSLSGFAFNVIPTYGTSSTGSASIGYTAYNTVASTILAVGNFATPASPYADGGGAQATGFTFTLVSGDTGLKAQQNNYAFTILTVAASSLARAGNPAKYWLFSNSGTSYYMWFQITNESDPAIGGRTGIKINLQSTDTSQDVANIVKETMTALQQTNIAVSAPPPEGSYFYFQTNPAATVNYLVWYTYLTTSTAPSVAGRIPIKVMLTGTPTNAQVVTATLTAVNAYQYAAPDLRGMFLRGADFTGIYDLDVAQRWSSVSGLSGANYGTFEYQQLLLHDHYTFAAQSVTPGGIANFLRTAIGLDPANRVSQTGGSETRPVNTYVNWCIRY